MYEALTTHGWLLARTTRLVQGPLVLCDPFRHPAVLARQAVTLDHASGGRFELGIGWGSVVEELTTYGINPTAARDRVERLGETLTILRALWTGDVVDFDGKWFQLVGARQRPTPLDRIPIVVGGTGRRSLALVAEHADWWNVPVHQLDRLDEMRPHVAMPGCQCSSSARTCPPATTARTSRSSPVGGSVITRSSWWEGVRRSSITSRRCSSTASSASTCGSPTLRRRRRSLRSVRRSSTHSGDQSAIMRRGQRGREAGVSRMTMRIELSPEEERVVAEAYAAPGGCGWSPDWPGWCSASWCCRCARRRSPCASS